MDAAAFVNAFEENYNFGEVKPKRLFTAKSTLLTPGSRGKGGLQLYVHNLLTQYRQEDIHDYFNPRHLRKISRDLAPAKKIFDTWKEDTVDTVQKVVKHDWEKMLISRIVPDHVELRKIKNEIISNFAMIKEVWHHLQSKSSVWPCIDVSGIMNMFTEHLGVGKDNRLICTALNNIALEVCVQGERLHDQPAEKIKRIKRYQFFEILVRMSLLMFTNQKIKSHNYDQHGHLLPVDYRELSPSQAWHCFLEYILRNYSEQVIQPRWHAFRRDQLWVYEVELLYTLNQVQFKALFKKYCRQGETQVHREEFVQMFVYDCKFGLSIFQVHQVYAMGQMTLVTETDDKAWPKYQTCTYVEFLEVIARAADTIFRSTEMEE